MRRISKVSNVLSIVKEMLSIWAMINVGAKLEVWHCEVNMIRYDMRKLTAILKTDK